MYYYMGKNALARFFPDIFGNSVPKGAVALAATILAPALDEYRKGVWRVGKLHVDTYRPIHEGILNLMDQIEKDRCHKSKCLKHNSIWYTVFMMNDTCLPCLCCYCLFQLCSHPSFGSFPTAPLPAIFPASVSVILPQQTPLCLPTQAQQATALEGPPNTVNLLKQPHRPSKCQKTKDAVTEGDGRLPPIENSPLHQVHHMSLLGCGWRLRGASVRIFVGAHEI
ncbi:uncharacterized protein EDB93DRAFT_1108884 [Suillus bovinus]|uniref:uncharacterized protein n=1 Tax=Suillus bovinus TaxID=48563 RepID=UPI001B865BAA|nr:uncharacterized protein EDB93DRAFT_1108884 [Suillus bovinus]KAG2128896.1 hypothetical protein EDB93DRAFT_1108884 [Suillus bovinus]